MTVAPPSREHQQATIRHPQHREEENHHPHLVEYRQGNDEELPEPPPEVPENCRSARSLSDMTQPSSLPDNDCAVVEPKAKDLRNDKGIVQFLSFYFITLKIVSLVFTFHSENLGR